MQRREKLYTWNWRLDSSSNSSEM